jgi:hypothetical protein
MHLKTLGIREHNQDRRIVEFHPEFEREFAGLPEQVRKQTIAAGRLLEQFGPRLGRPHVDTLYGSSYSNIKELRFRAANGAWRIAFAFDVRRRAILLVAGDKSGISKERFYSNLVRLADRRFAQHIRRLER